MAFVRCIGRWTMTALVINCIIGGGIYMFPGELTRLLGPASPLAMILAAIAMAMIMACVVEVGSKFPDPGGPYLYVRTAFGRFAGMQVGWFFLLASVGALASLASLFVEYLSTLLPWSAGLWTRTLALSALIAVPAVVNYRGARGGAKMSSIVTVAKLAPLALLILLGAIRFTGEPSVMHLADATAPGWANWATALGLLVFAFGGWEGAFVPAGEIKDPRRTIPFGAAIGLLACAAIYAFLQYIVVAALGTSPTIRPLADTANVLVGPRGGEFIAVAVLISTFGWISGYMLSIPRLIYSLSAQGDFPSVFARVHPRFHTPGAATLAYASAGWVLATTGSFLWIAALSAGAMMVYYGATCASLIRLRTLQPGATSLKVPFGRTLSLAAVAICTALIAGLTGRQLLLMALTAALATVNWVWAARHAARPETIAEAVIP